MFLRNVGCVSGIRIRMELINKIFRTPMNFILILTQRSDEYKSLQWNNGVAAIDEMILFVGNFRIDSFILITPTDV